MACSRRTFHSPLGAVRPVGTELRAFFFHPGCYAMQDALTRAQSSVAPDAAPPPLGGRGTKLVTSDALRSMPKDSAQVGRLRETLAAHKLQRQQMESMMESQVIACSQQQQTMLHEERDKYDRISRLVQQAEQHENRPRMHRPAGGAPGPQRGW